VWRSVGKGSRGFGALLNSDLFQQEESLFRAIRNPLLILLLTVGFEAIAWLGWLPSQGAILESIGKWVVAYGILAVFGLSLLENVVVFNGYFPGSVAILAAMASTNGDPSAGLKVWTAIAIGSVIGQIVSFLMGRRVPSAPPDPERRFWISALLTYWHPQLGSISSFASGAQGMNLSRFLSALIPILTLWNIFWGVLMFSFGSIIDLSQDGTWIILLLISFWIAVELVLYWRGKHRRPV
jgi:membrane protein DedA with SNARE-associated domain